MSGQLSVESVREELGMHDDLDFRDGRKVPRITRTGLGLTYKASDAQSGGMVVQ